MKYCYIPSEEFWKNKRVFVTGHTGFKGGWLTAWLNKLGSTLYGFSLAPGEGTSLFHVLGLNKYIKSKFGDVRDYVSIKHAIEDCAPDVVIHMAAQPIVSLGYEDPVGTFSTNVMGVVNILEACRMIKRPVPILIISSDKCYLNDNLNKPFQLTDPLGGHDPYSASKAGTEIVTAAYRSSFFSEHNTPMIASARAGNVIGGGDWAKNRLIPDIIKALMENRTIEIRNPNATRPWQHVLEPISGYLKLIEQMGNAPGFDTAWNFGPFEESTATVDEIFSHVTKCWNPDVDINYVSNGKAFKEAQTLKLDITETHNKLEWRPMLNLDLAVRFTVEWYKEFYNKNRVENMYNITQSQIDQYVSIQHKYAQ